MARRGLIGLWPTLISWAAWKPSKICWMGNPRVLGVGQLVTSQIEIARFMEWSRQKVQRELSYLKKRASIEIESGTKGIIITILNYEKYQFLEKRNAHQNQNFRASTGHQPGINRAHANEGSKVLSNPKEAVVKTDPSQQEILGILRELWKTTDPPAALISGLGKISERWKPEQFRGFFDSLWQRAMDKKELGGDGQAIARYVCVAILREIGAVNGRDQESGAGFENHRAQQLHP